MATPAQEYAQWYANWERELDKALRDAARTAERAASALPVGATGTLRGVRVRMASATLGNGINALFGDIERMLRSGRIEAAALAGRVVAQSEVQMLRDLGMSARDAAYFAQAESLRAVAALESAGLRATQTGIPLSQQVYRTQALSSGMVDKMVTSGLAQGLNARDLAKSVRKYIDPTTPGGVSYASKRLARTEINNTYHQSAINRMKAKPWVEGIQWVISGSHPKNDICDEYAETDGYNLGAGVYPPGEAPDKPHPQCMCYVTSVMPDEEQFLQNLYTGQYDNYIDDIMGQSGYTEEFISSSQFSAAAKLPPRPLPDGSRPPYRSKDPLVVERVAQLNDEQYLRWVTRDPRPVAKKMADPFYAVKPTTPKPAPTPSPVPKPSTTYVKANQTNIPEATNLTADQVAVIEDYQAISGDINGYLRRGARGTDPKLEKMTEVLDDVIDGSTPFKDDVVLWRGIDDVGSTPFARLKVGETITDDAFLSTTTEFDLATEFAEGLTPGKGNLTVIKINAPKGTKGLRLPDEWGTQQEVLMGRGSTLRVTSRGTQTIEGQTVDVIETELVSVKPMPKPAAPKAAPKGAIDATKLPAPQSVTKTIEKEFPDLPKWKKAGRPTTNHRGEIVQSGGDPNARGSFKVVQNQYKGTVDVEVTAPVNTSSYAGTEADRLARLAKMEKWADDIADHYRALGYEVEIEHPYVSRTVVHIKPGVKPKVPTATSDTVGEVSGVVKAKPTAIKELQARLDGGSLDNQGWRIDGNRIMFDNEAGRQSALRLAKDVRDVNLDNASDMFLSAQERGRARVWANNLQDLIDDLEKAKPVAGGNAATATVAEAFPKNFTTAEVNALKRSQELMDGKGVGALTNSERNAIERARRKWVAQQPTPRSDGYTAVSAKLRMYYEQQFDIRFRGYRVEGDRVIESWSSTLSSRSQLIANPWDEVAADSHTFDSKMMKTLSDGTNASRIEQYSTQAKAQQEMEEAVQAVYDRMVPGQLGHTRAMMVPDELLTYHHGPGVLADANANMVVRLSDTVYTYRYKYPGGRSPSMDNGWWAKMDPNVDSFTSTVTHEYGHIVDFTLTTAERNEAFDRIADALGVPRQPVYKGGAHSTQADPVTLRKEWMRDNKTKITNDISKYASENEMEIMAELFSEALLSSYPRPAALAYKQYLIEIGRLKP